MEESKKSRIYTQKPRADSIYSDVYSDGYDDEAYREYWEKRGGKKKEEVKTKEFYYKNALSKKEEEIYVNDTLELFKSKLLTDRALLRSKLNILPEEETKVVLHGIVIFVKRAQKSPSGARFEIVLDVNGILCKTEMPWRDWDSTNAEDWVKKLREVEAKEKTITVYEYVK